MAHCRQQIGDAYFRTPRTTIKAFCDLLSLLEQNPDRDWREVLGHTDGRSRGEPRPGASGRRLTSSSEAAFERLARPVQKWVHAQGLDEPAGRAGAGGRADPAGSSPTSLITASTAGGKTEAAFLPILSALVESRERGEKPTGVEVLAISPLKALINDQTARLEEMCADLHVPVHAWHGDVPRRARRRSGATARASCSSPRSRSRGCSVLRGEGCEGPARVAPLRRR